MEQDQTQQKIEYLNKIYDEFLAKVEVYKKEHKEAIQNILNEIQKEKLRKLREKLDHMSGAESEKL